MTLAFSQQINGTPTYFPEKIWAGIKEHEVTLELGNYLNSPYSSGKNILECKPKLHTIREDLKNRWKIGSKIHFVINNRTKNRLQFAPVITVKAIQFIKITYDENICNNVGCEPAVFINGKALNKFQFEELSMNDGFDNAIDFCHWFDKGFEGKLIHWTNKLY